MRKLYSFFAALCFVAMPQSVLADDWTYDFEDFSTVYGDHYANSSFDVTLNGLILVPKAVVADNFFNLAMFHNFEV